MTVKDKLTKDYNGADNNKKAEVFEALLALKWSLKNNRNATDWLEEHGHLEAAKTLRLKYDEIEVVI